MARAVRQGPQAVGHDTNLAVEAKSFTDSYHDDGSPMDYAADVVLWEDGKPVKEHLLKVNSPLKQGRIMFNQSYFKKIVRNNCLRLLYG